MPRTPGGVYGEAARRARPGAGEFRWRPSAPPSRKKKSSPIRLENGRGGSPGFCGPKHFGPANSAATLGSTHSDPCQSPACVEAARVLQRRGKFRFVATHVSWFTWSPRRGSQQSRLAPEPADSRMTPHSNEGDGRRGKTNGLRALHRIFGQYEHLATLRSGGFDVRWGEGRGTAEAPPGLSSSA